jgi:SAM-dependent methyltransferase
MMHMTEYLRSLVEKGGPDIPDYDDLASCFRSISALLRYGEISPEHLATIWSALGEAFCSTKTMQGFTIVKPHGYAGDFEIIDRIYQQWHSPEPQFARWDTFYHTQQAPRAVRNRKEYFLNLVDELAQLNSGEDMSILNVGCGPSRDVLEAMQRHSGALSFECIDMDPRAITYAKNLTGDFANRIQFHQCNAFRFSSPTRFPFVWSAGLFDYLSERAFRKLLKRLLQLVRPGGRLVVGNFSPANGSRDLMECGGWHLNYRTEMQLQTLARECGAPLRRIFVDREPEGVNLFLHIWKT